jgi:hypothetical protein
MGTLHVVTTVSLTYDGAERVTVAAGTFDARRIKDVTSTTLTDGAYRSSTTSTVRRWWAPSIGFLVKEESMFESTGSPPTTRRAELVDYVLI